MCRVIYSRHWDYTGTCGTGTVWLILYWDCIRWGRNNFSFYPRQRRHWRQRRVRRLRAINKWVDWPRSKRVGSQDDIKTNRTNKLPEFSPQLFVNWLGPKLTDRQQNIIGELSWYWTVGENGHHTKLGSSPNKLKCNNQELLSLANVSQTLSRSQEVFIMSLDPRKH